MKSPFSGLIQGIYFYGSTPHDFFITIRSSDRIGTSMGSFYDDFGWAVFLEFDVHADQITFKLLYTDPCSSGFHGHMEVTYSLRFDYSHGFWIGTVTTLGGKHSFKVHAVVMEVDKCFFDPFLNPSYIASE